jgi:hypothetical protein
MFLRHSSQEATEQAHKSNTRFDDADQFRYMARPGARSSFRSSASRDFSDAFIGGTFVLFAMLSWLFTVALFGLAVWALVFGIVDLNTVGFNGWAVAWIVIGILGILAMMKK